MAKPYEVETSIHIDAPIKKVYEVMLDLNQFNEWNPFLIMAKGGKRLSRWSSPRKS